MSGPTLNDLIATVFLRASNPPLPPPPHQFDSRAPQISSSSASSSSQSDPAQVTLSLLERAQRISESIGVISPNDALGDISTSSLRTLFLASLAAELHSAVRTGIDHSARKHRLRQSQEASAKYLNRVLGLGVVPPSTRQLVRWTLHSVPQAELEGNGLDSGALNGQGSTSAILPHSREVKIATFKLERELKDNLDKFRHAYQTKNKLTGVKAPSDVFYDLLLYHRQASSNGGGGKDTSDAEEAEEDDDEEVVDGDNQVSSNSAPGGIATVRQYLLALLNLHTLRNAQLITSASQEHELLGSIPPPPPTQTHSSSSRQSGSDASNAEWRLDRGPTSSLPTTGALMAPGGKVLRPFTITNKSRAELNSEVFRSGYRLPTMSIDEYLEEEQRRGNILQGGGQASYDKPTSKEERQLRMEQDGTKDAEQAEEEQRQKDLDWDTFSEQNKRGAGNTMNRG
ncbi:related to TAP42 - component of the Tor signaling pathway [Melanopsichium pennsylvanicum]|uniref:Related to TAP42 - component of the Tor signaling pathway n=2 Tax=Melanopsichium pennsylvanicum TaxID=63383 RepID=A0AAJ4XSW0_9BASI|nr:related to TAP42-component of the Tor signaling pathway [Melanopsichium pennsylvanicum 4]SNX87817.1 related to TAP42 - component of the Tor signaling pathway [Melanopsichium pennsylvanicum]